jgi:hypothetical protein
VAKLKCADCGAHIQAVSAGRRDGRLVYLLHFSCDCRLGAGKVEDAFWHGHELAMGGIVPEPTIPLIGEDE